MGALGVLIRRNPLIIFMSVELMLNAANLAFVAFARSFDVLTGQIFVFFVMTVSAAEVAVGLALDRHHLPHQAQHRRRRDEQSERIGQMTSSGLFSLVPLIVFLPVLGLLINLIFGGRMSEKVIGMVASAASGLAFVVSVLLGYALWSGGGEAVVVPFADWIHIGALNVAWNFPGRYPLGPDDAGRLRRRHADPHLCHRLHARGCALQERHSPLSAASSFS